MSNTFGNIFRLTSFGESHGAAVGGIIDGCPPGLLLDMDFIEREMNRRRPGQSLLTTSRRETDRVTFLSGLHEGRTAGTPIGFAVWNENQHSGDYQHLADVYRPSHADYTYRMKYGLRDPRGGGRSSARETAARCVAGAVAKLVLRDYAIRIQAFTSQIGEICLEGSYRDYDLERTDDNDARCPDGEKAAEMARLIKAVKGQGDSVGGCVSCVITGVPPGIGEPVFGKLHAALGGAMLSIPAVKGFEYGDGFDAPRYRGSEHNDAFVNDHGRITTRTNYSGGIQGGISNGQDIYFRVAFKAVATLLREQDTVNSKGEEVVLKAHGRHDSCVIPRAVPVVEAMAALTMLDYLLLAGHKKNA